jgi:hypothetical protein
VQQGNVTSTFMAEKEPNRRHHKAGREQLLVLVHDGDGSSFQNVGFHQITRSCAPEELIVTTAQQLWEGLVMQSSALK